ncbi:uncharacterized protein EURHEDRAFT_523761 [Aspergillus ruber CBS 135680]|uniref:Uncharacterized protein n=1 Tax=Aspergillus ruber (strain CBS 135680) TaxID=1388766 RepID=A0A017SDK8_ASPRC|nr:uncharacterized protein EURHEDRAFT_523761 [Aspergillus ruber CBS 135680]EYE94724.1 hypothetical protein EURHEDRAFT_523761 [Aspergillus ruber CBS 135680]
MRRYSRVMDEERLVQPGLSTIYTGKNPLIDIIAVDGPDEDVFESFTSKNGTFWLEDKDMLPKDIPSCRILTFRYSTSHYSDPAIVLVEDLVADRDEISKRRPIIFLCHSSGGTLVRDALAYSESHEGREKRTESTRSICVSTFGLLLFDDGSLLKTGLKLLQIIPNNFQKFCDHIASEAPYSSADSRSEDISEILGYNRITEEHQDKCKFSSRASSGYKKAVQTLLQYSDEASRAIPYRWEVKGYGS